MKKTNPSAKKKLVPALAMLATSAVALSTATYAWFTMNKEVEVTGIQLTATTPDLIEISFGKVEESVTELSVPGNGADDAEWVHSAATGSIYSSFGKIKPASSINGDNLYYTDNATEFGKNVSNTAVFKVANKAVTKTLVTGAKLTEETGDNPTATTNADDEGYYVDIPVWFRTTKDTDINLGVKATFDDVTGHGTYALYNAARVAILDPSVASDATDTVAATPNSVGVIKNGTNAKYYNKHRAVSATSGDYAVNAVRAVGAATDLSAAYGAVKAVDQTTESSGTITAGDTVAVVSGRTSEKTSGYSTPTKKIIRVWLEGEDEACWNQNASQDFVISLKFYDIGTPSTPAVGD